MPVAIEFILKLPENEKVHRAMGSILQGALMEILDAESADKLHEDGLRPYSQFIYFDKNKNLPIWRVNVLNNWAYEKILIPLQNQQEIFLRHKNYSVKLQRYDLISAETYEEMANRFMSDGAQIFSGVDIKFLTTTSFRRDGQYVIFPEVYLLIQSLLNRWNKFSVKFGIEDDTSKILANFCRVKEYALRTQNFLLEHQTISGFCGTMKIKFEDNALINNLLAILFNYANYAGVGIKTALGMGATKTILK